VFFAYCMYILYNTAGGNRLQLHRAFRRDAENSTEASKAVEINLAPPAVLHISPAERQSCYGKATTRLLRMFSLYTTTSNVNNAVTPTL
jgi:hypothetical protein